jgi:hypothetical protein
MRLGFSGGKIHPAGKAQIIEDQNRRGRLLGASPYFSSAISAAPFASSARLPTKRARKSPAS